MASEPLIHFSSVAARVAHNHLIVGGIYVSIRKAILIAVVLAFFFQPGHVELCAYTSMSQKGTE